MKKKTTQKRIPYLDYECKVGERVYWRNMKNETFEGTLLAWDENIALVKLDDGTEESVKC